MINTSGRKVRGAEREREREWGKKREDKKSLDQLNISATNDWILLKFVT